MNNKIIKIFIFLSIISILGLIVSLFLTSKSQFKKPLFDTNAIKGIPNVNEQLEYAQVEITDGYSIYVCANLLLNKDKIKVYFTSEKENTIYVKLRILDEKNNIIGETGLLKPGEYVEEIKINKKINKNTKVKMKIMGYEKDTYYSAGVAYINNEIKIGEK